MFNGLRWMESVLERVGLGGVVEEVYGALRARVLGAPPPAAPRLTQAVAPVPVPKAPAPVQARPPEPPPPAPAPREETPEEMPRHEAAPAPSPKTPRAPRARKTVRPQKKVPAVREAAAPRSKKAVAPPAPKAPAPSAASAGEAVGALVGALRAHPRHQELLAAGQRKDQLLRSLIPIYLARSVDADVEVTSGVTSRFWGELGVTYAAPNAAKALRLNTGFTQDTKKGRTLTAKGVKYVEAALTSPVP